MLEVDSHIYEFENYRIDADKRLLFGRDGEPVALMPKAFEILLYLVRNGGRVIEKDELMSSVWPDTIVEENNLTQNISALRRVLGEKSRENRFIVTVPGHGYKFVADVREADAVEEMAGDDGNTVRASPPPDATYDPDNSRPADSISGRKWLIAIGVLCVFALASMGLLLWRERAAGNPDERIRSLAVLPFKPLGPKERDESLELGMADTLIMKLGGNAEMTVRPLAAVMRFGTLEQDPAAAGRALGVDAVIDGNIQSSEGRVRVNAKLIRVRDGKQLWAGKFDENSTDIFAIQDSISQRAADALRVALGSQGYRRYTDNAEAYELYMKGRFHTLRLIRPEVEKGISYFEQAIAVDTNYTLAYIGLANASRALVLTSDVRPMDVMPKGKEAAKKAVELDPALGGSWNALANYTFWYDFDWAAAERQYKKAIDLDPADTESRALYAHMLSNTGRHDEALAQIRRARELDPVSLLVNALEGQMLFFAGRGDEARSTLDAAGEMDPKFWLVPLFKTRIYLQRQMYDEAIAAARRASELSGGNAEAEAIVGYALARSGRKNEAVEVLSALEKRAASTYVPSYDLAFLHLALGDRDESVSLLEKAFANHEAQMVFLKVDPKWDDLRGDARFRAIMARMHLDQ